MTVVSVGNHVQLGQGKPLALIAGPCVLEDERVVLEIAERLARLAADRRLALVFKASYEKDNRSSVDGYRGPGLAAGLRLLARVRELTGLPILSDVHREADLAPAAAVLDVVQIPAYLCRQTSLLLAAGRCCRVVNLKKGQFVAPEDMRDSVDKVRAGGCQQLLLTERGTCFGYRRLLADLTSIPILQETGWPVVFDASHLVREYGLPSSDPAGGRPRFIPLLARAAVAAGCDALFVETHPRPEQALCDAASMLPLAELPALVESVQAIAEVVRRPLTSAARG